MADPKPPKRPLNAYMVWSGRNRAALKAEYPSLVGKAFTTKLGELYHQIDADEKAQLDQEYKEAMAKWKVEYEQFKLDNPDYTPPSRASSKKAVASMSAFALFYGAELAKLQIESEKTLSKASALKKIVKKWEALKSKDLKKWEDAAKRALTEGVLPKKKKPTKKEVAKKEVEVEDSEEESSDESSDVSGSESSSTSD
ncbi:hypothetical protein ADUPG1_010694 [Aduncisulcus paluster]|uniref:HMG box domain-containing protein n=1 Tax=Aduncisulcus paluster TaxID=2918883 RepID=A0ABQ5JW15_9EUKA|nr:hypothetical protein ADUPG1_010694 [Aduncisulcus paluster]